MSDTTAKRQKSRYSKPVIENAKHVPVLIQIRDVVLTILVWFLYLYLMRDFFVFTHDAIEWTFNGFADTETYTSFRIIHTMIAYVVVILIMEVLFVMWSLYNLLRFGKKKRRSNAPPVSVEEMAKMYNVSSTDVGKWRGAQTVIMHHDKVGNLVEVELN